MAPTTEDPCQQNQNPPRAEINGVIFTDSGTKKVATVTDTAVLRPTSSQQYSSLKCSHLEERLHPSSAGLQKVFSKCYWCDMSFREQDSVALITGKRTQY